jgi:hypothetical protein
VTPGRVHALGSTVCAYRRLASVRYPQPAGKPVACIVGANCYADSIDSIARRA